MCGIVGYIGPKQAQPILLESLKRLEYRGYDSAGIAIIDNSKSCDQEKVKGNGSVINVYKDKGTIDNIDKYLRKNHLNGCTGISHTRWATHGQPSKKNAHPHQDCKGQIALVHNGIIENYQELREKLIKNKHTLSSETDTEVLAI